MHANTKTEIKSVVHRRMSELKHLSQEQGSIFELETRLLRQHDVLKKLVTQENLIPGNLIKAAKIVTEMCADVIDVERISIWLLNDDSKYLECLDLYTR